MTHELFHLSRDRILMKHELFYLSRDRILMTHELFYLSRDQILITQELKILVRHRNLITRQLLVARASSNFPLKSRRADVEASGLIVRRKGVDMHPIASSVKGRKVRIRARVQLPNHYRVWW